MSIIRTYFNSFMTVVSHYCKARKSIMDYIQFVHTVIDLKHNIAHN